MPQMDTAKAVQLLDLMLEFFADDGHWTRGSYDDGKGGHCLVGALLHLGRKHCLPTAPVIAAQHTVRRQSVPAGLTDSLSPQVTRNQAGQLALPSSHCDIALSSQPISCCANTSNIVAWMVRS